MRLILATAILLLVACGEHCHHDHAQAPRTGPVQVVASFSILADLARQVGGDLVEVHALVGPGVDAHVYQPVPRDRARIDAAELVLAVGLDFEPWLDRMLGKRSAGLLRFGPYLLGQEEPAIGTQAKHHHHGHEHDDHQHHDHEHHEHDHGDHAHHHHHEHDPHFWHDVSAVRRVVDLLARDLAARRPQQAEDISARAAALDAELLSLDSWIHEQVATIPPERRLLATTHDSLGWFARAYGFEVAGDLLGSLSTETGEPSPQRIATLAERLRTAGVPAVFAEVLGDQRLMAALAEAANAHLVPNLYADALGLAEGPAATYFELMRHNVSTIVAALAP